MHICFHVKHFKQYVITFAVFAASVLLMQSCISDPASKAPAVTITNPAKGNVFERGDTIQIIATASDPSGAPLSLTLFIDNDSIVCVDGASLVYFWHTDSADLGDRIIKAIAVNEADLEGGDEITVSLAALELQAPQGLRATQGEGEIDLQWNTVKKAHSYTIFWTDDGSHPASTDHKIENITGQSFSHQNLDHTKTYRYRVMAVRGDVCSPLSAEVAESPALGPLASPPNPRVFSQGSFLKVSWTPVDGEGVTYTVRRKKSSGYSYYSTIAEGVASAEYLDTGSEAGFGYFYQVVAIDSLNSRQSETTKPIYGVITNNIRETERNNANTRNSLSFDTHYYGAEDITYGMDKFRIKGGYSGSYSIYSAASYKNFEADCFEIDIGKGDTLQFKLISGNMSGLWGMSVAVRNYYKYTTGGNGDGEEHRFTNGESYIYKGPSIGTAVGAYICVSMWEDLINYGAYNYEIEITIKRKL